MFPININRASKFSLLKVPGLGPVTVNRIIESRKNSTIKSIEQVGKVGVRLNKAKKYLAF
jgi:predicted DNA-binding helix-hairpin-helix protein